SWLRLARHRRKRESIIRGSHTPTRSTVSNVRPVISFHRQTGKPCAKRATLFRISRSFPSTSRASPVTGRNSLHVRDLRRASARIATSKRAREIRRAFRFPALAQRFGRLQG